MTKITREDIQRISNEATLLHFLQEKLNLPIPEDLTLEDITGKFSNFGLGLSGLVADQVLSCQELFVSPGKSSGIILIRFSSESGYAEALRAIAKGLDGQKRRVAELRFICMNEYFQPFALAHFNNSELADWQTAVLTIRAWTEDNTRIITGSEHDLSDLFSSEESSIEPHDTSGTKNGFSNSGVESNLSENLLTKLEKTGTPLGQYRDLDIHTGINLGHKNAFIIDEYIRAELTDDPNSANFIERFPEFRRISQKWRWELSNVIYIPSSRNKRWPWSHIRSEAEAERVFKETYPAISIHMSDYKDELKKESNIVEFYWEFPSRTILQTLERPKIIYQAVHTSIQAAYDTSYRFLTSATHFIPTEDLSLLAILNSKLFSWYAQSKWRSPNSRSKQLSFSQKNMITAPIVPRTDKQQAELLDLVQQILDDPYNFEVPDIERKIDQLIYKLYTLTPAEIDLIEEESNP